MLFHEKLIQRRRERGMTQEDLAERLSVSRQTISKWENGECMPDADKFIRLSDILEISLDELAGREVEVEPIVLPAPELAKPGKQRRWTILAAAACVLLSVICFCLGRYVFPKTTQAEVGPTVTLPETLKISGFSMGGGQAQFTANTSIDGMAYLYQIGYLEPIKTPAIYGNGVYTVSVPQGVYDKMVLVITADGQERSALLATNLEIDGESMGWSSPND